MNDTPNQKISAILRLDRRLEKVVAELKTIVAHHQISIQDVPLSSASDEETHEAFLSDDFGWVLGFSFSIPLTISMIIFIFFIGDFRINFDNIFYGILGAIIGSILGFIAYKFVKNHHDKKLRCQEKHGGYLLIINLAPKNSISEIKAILNKWGATDIEGPEKIEI